MVVGGSNSRAGATKSIAIGTNVRISESASNAVAVSAYTLKLCATTEPGSLILCADKNVTIEGSVVVNGVDGSALVVNGVDVLRTTSNLKAELLNTNSELANTKTKLAASKPRSPRSLMWSPRSRGPRPRPRQAPRLFRWWARFLPSASPPPLSREPSPTHSAGSQRAGTSVP